MRFVVTYDISSDASRKLVAGILEGLLTRVQYSVFEGEVPRDLLDEAVRQALPYLDASTDSLRVYRLCATCSGNGDIYGRNVATDMEEVTIL